MIQADHEFGRVSSLKADAVGEPGSRRFRLLVESRDGRAANLWMEKEQLFNLGVALKRIIAAVEEEGQKHTAEQSPAEGQGELAAGTSYPVEFQVARLAVGYDERTTLFTIAAHASEEEGEGEEEEEKESAPAISLTAVRQEVDALADAAFQVCAAGRPRCALCGVSMGPERHICPKHNGHGTLES